MGYFFLVGLTLWLAVLSWVLYRTRSHYLNLISRTKKDRLDEILDTLIVKDQALDKELEGIKKEVLKLGIESKNHFQKIGLIRFNPFKLWGTDQSFVIALLDGQDTGLVINYIYTKEGLRVYTKRVKQGKGQEYELAEEEKKAIEKSKLPF